MKQLLRMAAIILATVAFCGGIALAEAETASFQPRKVIISVTYGGNIKVNGILFQPTDAAGTNVEAFVHSGTTYVPLRAISQL